MANCTVVIQDNISPTITCPTPAQSYATTLDNSADCFYTVDGTELDPAATDDNCSVASVTHNFGTAPETTTLAGAEFPIGSTDVIWTVEDAAGNMTSCTITVVVIEGEVADDVVVEEPVCSDTEFTFDLVGALNNGLTETENVAFRYTVSSDNDGVAPAAARAEANRDGIADTYTNETGSPATIVYTITPVELDGTTEDCVFADFLLTVVVNPEPVLDMDLDVSVCSGDETGVEFAVTNLNVLVMETGTTSLDVIGNRSRRTITFGSPQNGNPLPQPVAGTGATVKLRLIADIDDAGEFVSLDVEGNDLGDFLLADVISNGRVVFGVRTSNGVGDFNCNGSNDVAQIMLAYETPDGTVTYTITNVQIGDGLTSGGGNPVDPSSGSVTDLPADEISDDIWVNETPNNLTVVYTVVPVSAAGCEGDSKEVTVTVEPRPIGTDTTLQVCSDQQFDIDLNEFLQNIGDISSEEDDDIQPVSFVWEEVGGDIFLGFFNPAFNPGGELAEGTSSTIPFLAENPFGAGGAALTAVYEVTPTSAGGQSCEGETFIVTVIVNPSFEASISQNGDNTLCYGESRTLNALPNSGDDYTYDWMIVSGGGTIDPEAGNTTSIVYTAPETSATNTVEINVTVTEVATNCVEEATVTFNLEELPVVVANASLTLCETEVGGGEATFDLTDADEVVTTTEGVTVTYHESEGNALLGIQAIDPADAYTSGPTVLFARIVKGECFSVGELELIVNPKPVLEVAVTNALCSELLGSATVTVTNAGDEAFTYSLTGGPSQDNGVFVDLVPNIEGEEYEVTVTNDDTGCANTITFIITEPDEVVTMATPTDVACFNEATGSITVSSTGGDGSYTYTIEPDATFDEASNTFTGLTAGTYEISTLDGNDCSGDMPIMVTIREPGAALSIEGTAVPASCNGFADGEVGVTVGGGTEDYTFAWTTADGTIPDGQEAMEDLTGLTAGVYNLKVTDMNGCMEDMAGTQVQRLSTASARRRELLTTI